jgi:hypothetical protein
MKGSPSWLALSMLSAAALAVSGKAAAENGFMGHYGYMITMPDSYSTQPSFAGSIEKADIFPKTCAGHTRKECDLMGLVELAVLPKRMIAEGEGLKDFKSYTADILNEAKKMGLKTVVKHAKHSGFPAVSIVMPDHPQPLNAMILVEGSLVYYRFKYHYPEHVKIAKALSDAIKEIAPHDTPPPPGAR